MIFFRDYLLKHPETQREYAAIKKRALASGKHDNASYNAEKAPFIAAIMAIGINLTSTLLKVLREYL